MWHLTHEKNFDESRAGFLLVHAKRRVLWGKACGRLAGAIILQALHMTIIIQFFLTTALVLGVSDGLFNIVLNSVAIGFMRVNGIPTRAPCNARAVSQCWMKAAAC